MWRKTNYYYMNNIGPRTIFKTLCAYPKVKSNTGKRYSKNLIINGNTKLKLAANAEIINNGTFFLGFNSREYPSLEQRACVFQMDEKSKMIVNGKVWTESGAVIRLSKGAL